MICSLDEPSISKSTQINVVGLTKVGISLANFNWQLNKLPAIRDIKCNLSKGKEEAIIKLRTKEESNIS